MTSPATEFRSALSVTRQELEDCIALGLTQQQTAERLGIRHARYVGRREAQLGISRGRAGTVRTPVEGEIAVLAMRLSEDGQPSTWVRETLNCIPHQLRRIVRHRPNHEQSILEWKQAWSQIRRDPTLLALHYQFAPKEGSTVR